MAYAVARKALLVDVENLACMRTLFFDSTTCAETPPPRRTLLHNRNSSTPRRAAFLDLLQSPLPLSHLTTGEDRSYSMLVRPGGACLGQSTSTVTKTVPLYIETPRPPPAAIPASPQAAIRATCRTRGISS